MDWHVMGRAGHPAVSSKRSIRHYAIDVFRRVGPCRCGTGRSKLAPFECIMLLSVILLSYLVWSELPDVNTMGGSLIMIGSGL